MLSQISQAHFISLCVHTESGLFKDYTLQARFKKLRFHIQKTNNFMLTEEQTAATVHLFRLKNVLAVA